MKKGKTPLEASTKRFRFEPETLAVAAAVYGGFGLVTWYFHALPLWVAVPLGAMLIAWHGSLQHETIHGHPFVSRRLNAFLGGVPLSLFIPYPLYRRSHLWHHRFGGRILTDPIVDPESFYLTRGFMAEVSAPIRFLCRANTTLLGRLILGPLIATVTFLAGPARSLALGHGREWRIWAAHSAAVATVLLWVVGICKINVFVYIACFVYPGQALTLLRSFAEHRASADPAHRTAVVEANPLLSLIFLYNNLHVVHHERPRLPWYALPAAWRQLQADHGDTPARKAGMVYSGGYLEVLRRYFLRPVIDVEHPDSPVMEQPPFVKHGTATGAVHSTGAVPAPGAVPPARTIPAARTVSATGTATAV